MKKWIKRSLLILLFLFILIGATVFAIFKSPTFQTYITQKIGSFLSKETNTTITLQGVDFKFFKTFELEGLLVLDHKQDTMIYASELGVNLNLFNLDSNEYKFEALYLNNPKFYLKTYALDTSSNLSLFLKYFQPDKPSAEEVDFLVLSNTFAIHNGSFSLMNYNLETNDSIFNPNNIQLTGINLELDNIIVNDSVYSTTIKHLSVNQKNGVKINEFQGEFEWKDKSFSLLNLVLETQKASLIGDIKVTNPKEKPFSDFITAFKSDVHIKESSVVLSEFKYFAPQLKNYNEKIEVSFHAKGKVSDVRINDLNCSFGKVTKISGNADLNGLPDIDNTFIYADLKQLKTNFSDVENAFAMINPTFPLSKLNDLKVLKDFEFKGNFTGFAEDFVAYGILNSRLGTIRMDANFEQKEEGVIDIKGKVASKGFKIKELSGVDDLDLVAIDGDVIAKIKGDDREITFKGILPIFDFKGYRYNSVKLLGEMKNSFFEGDVYVKDENIDMGFTGNIDLSDKLQKYNFESDIKYAKLHVLNLIDRDSSTIVSGKIKMQLNGKNYSKLDGDIFVDSLTWTEKGDTFFSNQIAINTAEYNGKQMISLNSDWLTGKIEGAFNINQIVPSVLNVLARDLPGISDYRYYPDKFKGANQFRLMFRVRDFEPIHKLFLPDVHIPEGAVFSGRFNDLDNFIHFNFKADTVKLKGRKLTNFSFYGHNDSDRVNFLLNADNIEIVDTVGLQSFYLNANTSNNKVNYKVGWNNTGKYTNKVDLDASFDLTKIDSIEHHIKNASINYQDTIFKVDTNNLILFTRDKVFFYDFSWKGGSQKIDIQGMLSKNINDSIQVVFKRFNLINLDNFFNEEVINVKGAISGKLKIFSPLEAPLFVTDLKIKKFVLNDQKFGTVNINTKYFPKLKKVSAAVIIDNLSERLDFKTLIVEGDYYPFDGHKLDIDINVNNLRIYMLEKYVKGLFSNLDKGMLTGKLKLNGTAFEPMVEGNLQLDRMNFKVDYLNVDYSVNGQKIYFEKNKITIKDFIVTHDKWKDSKATINGLITHDYFSDFKYNLKSIKLDEFIALNTTLDDNSTYYGRGFVDGLLAIKGDGKNTSIEGDIYTRSYEDELTSGETTIQLPLDYVDELNVSEFIEFVNLRDTSALAKVEAEESIDLSGLSLNFNINLNENATAKIIFDPTVKEEIVVQGNGSINLSISPTGNFQMNGGYVISNGSYNFALKNFLSKKFLVAPGSEINWNGDPLSAIVDIKTIYQTRSKLLTLVDSNSVANYQDLSNRLNGRTLVNTNLFLKGNLLQPEITMAINLPEGTPEENDIIESSIIGEDETNRQAFALILTGQFLPPHNSLAGNVGIGTGIDNSVQFIERQLNNALGGMFNNVDLGFDYSSSDSLSAAELRLLVGFQYKNFRLSTDYDLNNNVGDVQVQYKITEQLRAKAFHKRTEQNLLDNGMNTIQGVGLLYQKAFDRFGDLFGKKEEEP